MQAKPNFAWLRGTVRNLVFLYFAGYLWMKILKAINNNIVSARDENGKEIVVMGRGIGFKCREGDSILPEAIEKIFHMDTQNETDRLKQLFSSMPLEHIEVTNRIIAYARKILGAAQSQHLHYADRPHQLFGPAVQAKYDVSQRPAGGNEAVLSTGIFHRPVCA